jgi:Zn-finger domain-containing protein
MPKSRQRKNHKQKVQTRTQIKRGLQKKYQSTMQAEMQSYLEKLSGMTENK